MHVCHKLPRLSNVHVTRAPASQCKAVNRSKIKVRFFTSSFQQKVSSDSSQERIEYVAGRTMKTPLKIQALQQGRQIVRRKLLPEEILIRPESCPLPQRPRLLQQNEVPVSAIQSVYQKQHKSGPSELDSQVVVLERSLQLPVQTPPAGSLKRTVDEQEQHLFSTWNHKLITCGTLTLIASLLGKGLADIDNLTDVLTCFSAIISAYLLSDFLTGLYHWGVDNYGDGATPIVGSQIAAFQGHHQRPWTITERQFCNNVHKVFMPAAPFTIACLLVSPLLPSWLEVGLASATFLTCMSQQFHAWAHMKASRLPPVIIALQDAGWLVSRKAHGAHHKAPFEGNYCIVSGVWNPILDAGGEKSFFRSLERYIYQKTGVEPRCWHEPDYSWHEVE